MSRAKITLALSAAREFIEGFEDDEAQEPGSIRTLLEQVDEAIEANKADALLQMQLGDIAREFIIGCDRGDQVGEVRFSRLLDQARAAVSKL